MLKDITLGQYYPGDSAIHKLDPRVKILGTCVYIVTLFLVKDFTGFLLAALFLLGIVAMSRIPLSFILRGLKPIFIIILFTFFVNLFLNKGQVLWQWAFLTITKEGLYRALFMVFRLILLIIGSSLLTYTTRPLSLTDGLECLMRPFKKIGLPAHELAMMMSIALRFIPTLMDESDKIMKAQAARGADFESGSLLRRAKALVPLLVPLFVSAFRIASDLAMAMEARCYRGGEHRTRLHPMKLKGRDALAVIVLAVFVAVILIEGRLGLFI